MAYSLILNAKTVVPYLRDLELSRAGRIALYNGLHILSEHADSYRNDPSLRFGPGSPYFRYEYLFQDGAGRVRVLWFVISDAVAAYGVLRVVYVDES